MKAKLLSLASFLLVAALGYLLFTTSAYRRRVQSELEAAHSELDRLQSEIEAAKKQQLPDAELARLKADQAEAVKLRNEAAALRQSLATTQSNIAATKQTAAEAAASRHQKTASADADSPAIPHLRMFNSQVAARLPTGHAIAIGGWKTSTDNRAFAILQPIAVNAAPGAAQQVQVAAKWIELSNDAATRLQLDSLLTAAGNNPTALPPEYLQQFLQTLQSTEGAKILASPRVLAIAGQEATVSVTSTLQTPNGPINIGPEIRVTPTPSADNSTVDLTINATLTVNAKE